MSLGSKGRSTARLRALVTINRASEERTVVAISAVRHSWVSLRTTSRGAGWKERLAVGAFACILGMGAAQAQAAVTATTDATSVASAMLGGI